MLEPVTPTMQEHPFALFPPSLGRVRACPEDKIFRQRM